jgi:taurine dioxygenase
MGEVVGWRPLSPFGASVDLDLSKEVDEVVIERLRALYDQRHLLVFPAQTLSGDAQVRISGWFGPTLADKGATYLATDPKAGGLGDSELAFHSDLSCAPEPLLGLSLHALEVSEQAPPTFFVDAIAAAASLPEPLRARLGGLQVMNLWPMSLSERQRSETAPAGWPGTAHPLLKPHPRTGAPILYLNASHTDRILELAPDESERLIQELFGRLYDPANRYEHRWRTGDFLVWDNLALQHARPRAAPGVVRTLQRVEIGAVGYAEQMPPLAYDGRA